MLNNTYGGDKITFHYRYRKQILLLAIIIILISSVSYFIITNRKKPNSVKKSEPTLTTKTEEKTKDPSPLEKYQVDIKGEVVTPGIYSLDTTSRVIDVINAAGGLTSNANTTVINLSKKITDEMVIIIYSNEEVADFKKTKELEKEVISKCQEKDENALKNDACISSEADINTLLSLNSATKEELAELPGIGEKKASDIINYRNENGPFETLEDLKNVSGIGESLFAKIKDYLTI